MENFFENDKYIIEYFPDRKTVEFILKDCEIEKKDIVEMHAATLAMTGTQLYATLYRAMDFFSINTEARMEGTKKHYTSFITVQAFVVKNLAQRLVGNFIMKFNTPARESKLFTTYEEARTWLDKRIKEINSEKIDGTSINSK